MGAAPFTLALPYVDLFWNGVLPVIIGLVVSSAFSAIVVFAQELVPGKVGMIAGIIFGLMFGVNGIGAAAMAVSPTSPASRRYTALPPSCRYWAS